MQIKNAGKWFTVMTLTAMAAVSGVVPTMAESTVESSDEKEPDSVADAAVSEETTIILSNEDILVNGTSISTDSADAVYAGAEIVYYKEGQSETYGAGSEEEEHSAEDAAKQQVITITQPGTYRLSGSLSNGQIAIDLGEDAKEDETAVVNLILDNVDITCDVAPAIIAYNVYECGSDDTETATKDVDVSETAGFHLTLADNSTNTVTGSHVAKIYKEGTTLEEIESDEAKKAHKYDAAIESQMSMSIDTEEAGNGQLTVYADNEGIETKLHMTVNGGVITVNANDDSINAGEDGVSVITFNGGTVTCDSGYGDGEEGDGIDSNGWIVINDGYIIACANARSQDSGLDSDMGTYINGGTVLGSGHMYDEISEESKQKFMVFNFSEDVTEKEMLLLTDTEGNAISAFHAVNDYSIIVYSTPKLEDGDYYLYKVDSVTGDLNGSIYTNITAWEGEQQLGYTGTSAGGFGGRMGGFDGGQGGNMENRDELPEGAERPDGGDLPEGAERPDGGDLPEGAERPDRSELPEGAERPDGSELPEGAEMPDGSEMPEGMEPPEENDSNADGSQEDRNGAQQITFTVSESFNQFSGIALYQESEVSEETEIS
ncbi:MAG: carbohydrate-binding domain-containing protein [Lachnospiraceae bacterium]|nr:carbohydrate-binding domain-containing protein [Lachnospiraceae bacterium]